MNQVHEVSQALEQAMERAAAAVNLDLWFQLRDARDGLARAFCHGVVASEVFQPWEPEYQAAGRILSTELPAAIEAARGLLQRIGQVAP